MLSVLVSEWSVGVWMLSVLASEWSVVVSESFVWVFASFAVVFEYSVEVAW